MWKKGPLPDGTFWWGGVVPTDHDGTGFWFADFRGDYVVMIGGNPDKTDRILKPEEVAFYNDSLDLPPGIDKHGTRKG